MIDWQALDALAQKQMAHRKAHPMRETGFIYRHGRRVAASVCHLRARVTDDASHDDALRIAGLFHDIGKGIEPHARSGALLARDLLAEYLPKALLDEVVALIANHCNHDAPASSIIFFRMPTCSIISGQWAACWRRSSARILKKAWMRYWTGMTRNSFLLYRACARGCEPRPGAPSLMKKPPIRWRF
jgi:hypothetical protein